VRLEEEPIFYGPNQSVQLQHRQEREFPFFWHWHGELEITMITKGRGLRRIGSDLQAYEAPECVIVPSQQPHSWMSQGEGENEAWICQFRLDAPLWQQAELRELHQWLCLNQARVSKQASLELFVALAESVETKRLARLLDFLDHLMKLKWTKTGSSLIVQDSGKEQADWMNRIQSWLEQGGKLSVPALAEQMYCSESSLRRYVKKHTGQTLTELLNDWRVEKAKTLLRSKEMGVLKIAYEVGFENVSHFHRQFKRHCGLTPKQYQLK